MSTKDNNQAVPIQPVLYMAMELGEKTWKLAFAQGVAQKPRLREVVARDTTALTAEVDAAKRRFELPPNTPVVSCYEAGRDGFWLHRFVTSQRITNVVVESCSILVDRRQRRAKTDRLDATKLLNMLVRWHQGEAGVWSVIEVPSDEDEAARHLHRELEALRREQTAHSNRIKGLLALCGLSVEVTRGLPKSLNALRVETGTQLVFNNPTCQY